LTASAVVNGGAPHEGPESLGFELSLNATNIGEYDITDFQVSKVTIFTTNLDSVYSFELTNQENKTITSGSF
jgi:hypothetical protein